MEGCDGCGSINILIFKTEYCISVPKAFYRI